MGELVKVEQVGQLSAEVREAAESARAYAADARSEATRRAYSGDWATFEGWCGSRGLPALPASPETVALFLAARADAGLKVATITRSLAAISEAHRVAGQPSPRSAREVREVLKGIRRRLGVAQTQKAPILGSSLRTIVAGLGPSLLDVRDRALLLVGFNGAFRRSELVALDVADLEFTDDGLAVTLRRSKTDQAGAGRKVGLPFGSEPGTCPARALKAWLSAAAIETGAVFRSVNRHGRMGGRLSPGSVARTVKARVAAVGLDPAGFAGHSLRAGLATSAAKAGKSATAIMKQTGHKSVAMVARYIRDAELFTDNAAAGLV
jgi:integrase